MTEEFKSYPNAKVIMQHVHFSHNSSTNSKKNVEGYLILIFGDADHQKKGDKI